MCDAGLRVLAVDDSGNKVRAFNGQRAVVTLQTCSPGGGAGGDGDEGGGAAAAGEGGNCVRAQKEIQLDMVHGEGDLASERWFVTGIASGGGGVNGQVASKAARNPQSSFLLPESLFHTLSPFLRTLHPSCVLLHPSSVLGIPSSVLRIPQR